MNSKYNIVLTILLVTLPTIAAAVGLGGVASSLMEPVSLATSFMHSGCFVLGAAFIFASLVKYMEHRKSPTMVPISTVFFLIVAGLVFIAIPIFTR